MARAWYALTAGGDPLVDSDYNYSSTAISTLCPISPNYICAVYANYTTGQTHPVLTTNLITYITNFAAYGTVSTQPSFVRKRPTP